MEAHDAHPIDAALRELSEETAYSGQFKSIKVIGGIVDPQNPTSAAIYVVADANEAFVPSPDAETPEHVEWRWAPAADCPLPAHPKMQQTQELFFESLPAEHLVPADGRLSAIHGTASWFPEFDLNKVVNGSVHGRGVYCGLIHSQAPEYAQKARLSQTPLHGEYVYKLEIATNIQNGGYVGVQKVATDAFLDRTIELLRAQQLPACDQLASEIVGKRYGAHAMTAAAVARSYAEAAGITYEQAQERLGIQGKWVPGFCYVAFKPGDVTIRERITLAPPASPKVVLTHAELEMRNAFERSISELRDMRSALSWATNGELGEGSGPLCDSIRNREHAYELAETARENYRTELLKVARESYGLNEAEAQYAALHERQIDSIRSALGSEVTLKMWAEQFPDRVPGKLARILIENPEVARDPELFVRMAAEVVRPNGYQGWELTRDSHDFSRHHKELLQTIWVELSSSTKVWLKGEEAMAWSARASKAARDKDFLEDILQPKRSVLNPAAAFRQAVDMIISASANVTEHRSLTDCLLEEYLGRKVFRLDGSHACRLALQLAERLSPEAMLTNLKTRPSFLPDHWARSFDNQEINRWLKTNQLSPKEISDAAPAVNALLRDRCSELANQHASAIAAATEAKAHYDEFLFYVSRLDNEAEQFREQQAKSSSDFSSAVSRVQLHSPILSQAAHETTLPCGLSLARVDNLLSEWVRGGLVMPMESESRLAAATSYLRQRSASDRVIEYAHVNRIMDRTDLHPSWTEEHLNELNSDAGLHRIDGEELRRAHWFLALD